MKFKKLLLSSILGIAFISTSHANGSMTEDINFTGEIITSTCSINSSNSNIHMGDILISKVNASVYLASITEPKAFTININNCTPENIQKVMFDNKASSFLGETNVLKNEVSNDKNPAQGVGILIKDEKNNVVEIDKRLKGIKKLINQKNSASLSFVADFVKVGTSKTQIKTGDFLATAIFTITYK